MIVLARLVALLKQYAGGFLRGEQESLEVVQRYRTVQSQELTEWAELPTAFDTADEAWNQKDLRAVVECLEPYRHVLPQRERRRLQFAKNELAKGE